MGGETFILTGETPARSARRIVSLLPSATEIVCTLGKGEELVGRSHECDYPVGVERLPILTKPKVAVAGRKSGEIHREVEDLLKLSLSVYAVDPRMLRELKPDLILTQTQCEICAVSLKEVEEALDGWIGKKPRILALAPMTLKEILEEIRRVALALEAEEGGNALLGRMNSRIERVKRLGERSSSSRVLVLEWLDPPMVGLNWMPELIRLSGGVPAVDEPGAPSRRISWEEISLLDPDFLLLIPCGFRVEQTMAELPEFLQRGEIRALRAYREGRIFVVDGNAYFNRPGPRIADSLEILAEILHPGSFPHLLRPGVLQRVPL
jgi:iron complex transport system substrate-binding protein